MKKKISIKTFYLLGIIGIGLIGLAVGSTYAMFTTSKTISGSIALSTTLSSDTDIVDTMEITVPAYYDFTKSISLVNNTSSTVNYTIWYLKDFTGNKVEFGIHDTDDAVTGTISSNGSKSVDIAIRNNTSSAITVIVGASTSTGSIILEDNMKVIPNNVIVGPTAANLITRLYINSEKTTFTSNGITYTASTQLPLIEEYSGNLDNNIRYFGANPNNYMYFNCSDYSNQTSDTCELWRIVGVFDGKLKIVKNGPIGNYSWDNKGTSTGAETANGSNDWTTARLMKLLNPGYESETVGGSLYWNSGSGSCYKGQNNATTTCDFTSTGLKNDVTRNMIVESNYSLLGTTTLAYSPAAFYAIERYSGSVYTGWPTSWTGKVGLLYASDYGYASNLTNCSATLNNYSSYCISNNWIYQLMQGSAFLLLNTMPDPYTILAINTAGKLASGPAYAGGYILPVVYLDPSVTFNLGASSAGTAASPYQIYVTGNSSSSGSSETTYTVRYNTSGGSGGPSTSTVTAGSTYTIPNAVLTYANYTFRGWYILGQSESVLWQPGDTITVNGDVTFVAAWLAPETVTVTLKKSAGSITTLTTQTLDYGSSFSYTDNSVTASTYTYSTTSCTNGQVVSVSGGSSSSSGNITVQSEEGLSPNAVGITITGRTVSIASVTADTVCTMYYTKASDAVTS